MPNAVVLLNLIFGDVGRIEERVPVHGGDRQSFIVRSRMVVEGDHGSGPIHAAAPSAEGPVDSVKNETGGSRVSILVNHKARCGIRHDSGRGPCSCPGGGRNRYDQWDDRAVGVIQCRSTGGFVRYPKRIRSKVCHSPGVLQVRILGRGHEVGLCELGVGAGARQARERHNQRDQRA